MKKRNKPSKQIRRRQIPGGYHLRRAGACTSGSAGKLVQSSTFAAGASETRLEPSAIEVDDNKTRSTYPVTANTPLYANDDLATFGYLALPVFGLMAAVAATLILRATPQLELERFPIIGLSAPASQPATVTSPSPAFIAELIEAVQPAGIVAPVVVTSSQIEKFPEVPGRTVAEVDLTVATDVGSRQIPTIKTQALYSLAKSVGSPPPPPASRNVGSTEEGTGPTLVQPHHAGLLDLSNTMAPVSLSGSDTVAALDVARMLPPAAARPSPAALRTWELLGAPNKVCRIGDPRGRQTGITLGPRVATTTITARSTMPAPPAQSMTDDVFGLRLAEAAKQQLSGFVIYNEVYLNIAYPMGDVPSLFGVCTDVIVRAYRSLGIDLQELVHRARVGNGDRNIDHRRTRVLRRFFSREAQSLPVTDFPEDYLPGDIVTYHRPQNSGSRYHIALVANEIAPSGRPMIIHNRGWGPQIEDGLFVDQITGHYRFRTLPNIKPPAAVPAIPERKPQVVRRDARLDIGSQAPGFKIAH